MGVGGRLDDWVFAIPASIRSVADELDVRVGLLEEKPVVAMTHGRAERGYEGALDVGVGRIRLDGVPRQMQGVRLEHVPVRLTMGVVGVHSAVSSGRAVQEPDGERKEGTVGVESADQWVEVERVGGVDSGRGQIEESDVGHGPEMVPKAGAVEACEGFLGGERL
ncbi:hypothetical protein ACFW96_28845 [Streptomyces gardneri]|uniref:hypothetical protein n=1 Tax=Streptomyces gardneri TaxID=66892 RepID=UPI00368F5F14